MDTEENPRSEARTRRVVENWECRSGYEIGEQSLECGDVVGVGETLDSQWEITVANRRPFSLLSPLSLLFLSLLCIGLVGRREKEGTAGLRGLAHPRFCFLRFILMMCHVANLENQSYFLKYFYQIFHSIILIK